MGIRLSGISFSYTQAQARDLGHAGPIFFFSMPQNRKRENKKVGTAHATRARIGALRCPPRD